MHTIKGRLFPLRLLLASHAALLLSACALSPYDEDGAVKKAAELVRIATPTAEPQDFVKEQRAKESVTYIPVGVTPPGRPLAPRDPNGVKALEAQLDADRKASETFAKRPKPKATYDGSKPPKVEPPLKELMPQ